MTEVWEGLLDAPDSMPITDGWMSDWLAESAGVLEGMLAASDCDGLLKALNFGVAPVPCENEESICSADAVDVVQECLKIGDRKLRFDTDCSLASMKCRGGHCVLGSCASDSCDEDSLVVCGSDREKSVLKCGVLGLTCANGGDGLQCVGKGVSCTTEDVIPVCSSATSLTWCLGGRVAVVDCGALTDGRRACSQDWLNKNIDIPAEDLLTKHLADACGPAGTECYGSASECEESYVKLCIDGTYEFEPCRDFRTDGCSSDGVFEGLASCKGFPMTK